MLSGLIKYQVGEAVTSSMYMSLRRRSPGFGDGSIFYHSSLFFSLFNFLSEANRASIHSLK